jgi:hypothetical protein
LQIVYANFSTVEVVTVAGPQTVHAGRRSIYEFGIPKEAQHALTTGKQRPCREGIVDLQRTAP